MSMKTVVAVLAFSVASFGQNPYRQHPYVDDTHTPNGRFWQEMAEVEKGAYLMGVLHGLQIALVNAVRDGKCQNVGSLLNVPPAAVVYDYEKEFDKLYSDSENLPINIQSAWTYVNTKLKGTRTKEQLERLLIKLRQDAASHVQH
jgi:hypothetical protein